MPGLMSCIIVALGARYNVSMFLQQQGFGTVGSQEMVHGQLKAVEEEG